MDLIRPSFRAFFIFWFELLKVNYLLKRSGNMATGQEVCQRDNANGPVLHGTRTLSKAELVDYSSVKAAWSKAYGYRSGENIQKELDLGSSRQKHEKSLYAHVHPESLLQKEKDHVEGFAPEVAWVTHGGSEKLTERLCVRPTSETLFCDHYKNSIQSYRDLPKLYNQWCSVVRWEKNTRPFLRTLEFLWQEGHTAHATAEEAQEETIRMLNVYAEFCENVLAIPVVKGQKSEKEKFAGAMATYTIEALMHNGIALQSGTSHNFGDGFAKAFGIQYTDKSNQLQYMFIRLPGNDHQADRRDNHGAWRRQRACAAAEGCSDTGRCHTCFAA